MDGANDNLINSYSSCGCVPLHFFEGEDSYDSVPEGTAFIPLAFLA